MGSILIALPKPEDANRIATMVRGTGLPMDISLCETGAEILRIANDRDYGVVICTKRLRDMAYSELAEMMPRNFGMIILTNDMSIETFRDDMVKLTMPFKTSDLINTINMLTSGYMRRPKKKNQPPPPRREEDKKIIDAAKAVLMERNGMSEPEAFRYIQKNSMDCGRKLTETANMILTLYGD